MKPHRSVLRRLPGNRTGAVFVEYLLLVTIIGIGIIVGLVALRAALISELQDLAGAISALSPSPAVSPGDEPPDFPPGPPPGVPPGPPNGIPPGPPAGVPPGPPVNPPGHAH